MSAVKENIELTVDNETIEVSICSHHLLIDILRDHCGRKSVKEGCEFRRLRCLHNPARRTTHLVVHYVCD